MTKRGSFVRQCRQSGPDNQIGHNLDPAVLQSEKLQFQNLKKLKMEAGTK